MLIRTDVSVVKIEITYPATINSILEKKNLNQGNNLLRFLTSPKTPDKKLKEKPDLTPTQARLRTAISGLFL